MPNMSVTQWCGESSCMGTERRHGYSADSNHARQAADDHACRGQHIKTLVHNNISIDSHITIPMVFIKLLRLYVLVV